MTELIRGKVARILNSRVVIINAGSEKGVTVGMCFDIMGNEDIVDPDTKETLGSIERATLRVKVTEVQEKMSFASTYKTRKVNVGGHGLGLGVGTLTRAFAPPEWVTRPETINTQEETLEDETENYVKTGDAVVQVIEETEDALPAA